MKVLLAIPARGGSRRLPRKNLRTVGGVSLVGRAVLAAREFRRRAGLSDARIIVDTDSSEIASEAGRWGAPVPFLRPRRLAEDDTPTIASTLHLLERLESNGYTYEAVVLLQPTSPLRSADEVLECWAVFLGGAEAVTSVTEFQPPMRHVVQVGPGGLVLARDPTLYCAAEDKLCGLSGSVYVTTPEFLRRHRAFVVPGVTATVEVPLERSLDVDVEADLLLAECSWSKRPVRALSVGRRSVGGVDAPCFVIAEAGVNHNGDLGMARELVDAAANAGADAVKFQTFDPVLVAAPDAEQAEYQVHGAPERGRRTETQREMLARLVLSPEAHLELRDRATAHGLAFLSSPFDEESAKLLDSMGIGAFKIASGEVTNHPLLAGVAAFGKPMLISTGMSTMDEVADALECVRRAGGSELALLHCVTSYPTPTEDCNLRAMNTMRVAFGLPVGWSDHTEGVTVALAAVAAGAEILEKHFTLSRGLPGPDHAASLEPQELQGLVTQVREVERAMGSGQKEMQPSEAAVRVLVRRSLHARRNLEEGELVGPADLIALRPATGIPPNRLAEVVGRRVVRAVRAGSPINEDVLD